MIVSGFLLWLLAGLSAGLMIGLAGAGGAIMAIPLFVWFAHMSFRDAAGYALLVVSVGAFLSWFAQRQNTCYRTSLLILSSSVPLTYFLSKYKTFFPEWIDLTVLWAVCLFALHRIWIFHPLTLEESRPAFPLWKEVGLALLCGVALGSLVSLIGVGGGLVTVPFLLVVLKLSFREAIATDIFCILILAPLSAWRQDKFDVPLHDLSGLLVGTLTAAGIVYFVHHSLPLAKSNLLRKWALTIAIVLALSSSILESPFAKKIERDLGEHHAKSASVSPTL